MAKSQQTKHKHPPTRRMIAVRDTTIDLGGGKVFTVKKGNIIKVSKPYEGQAGRSVLVEPHGSIDGGKTGPSLFVANPSDLAGVFKPMANDSGETAKAYREQRGSSHAKLSGNRAGRRSFDSKDSQQQQTQKEETEMQDDNLAPETSSDDAANTVDNSDSSTNGTQYLVENAGYDYDEFLEFLNGLAGLESEEEYENVVESLDDDLRHLTLTVIEQLLAEASGNKPGRTNKAPYNPAREGSKTLSGTMRYVARHSQPGTKADAEAEKFVRDTVDRNPEKVKAHNDAILGKDAPKTADDETIAKSMAKYGNKIDFTTGRAIRKSSTHTDGDSKRRAELQTRLGLAARADRPATSPKWAGDVAHRGQLGTHVSKETGEKIATSSTPYPHQGKSTVHGDLNRNAVTKGNPEALRRAAAALMRSGQKNAAAATMASADSLRDKAKAERDKRNQEKTKKEETEMQDAEAQIVNESLAGLARDQNAIDFADIVQRRLDQLAHNAIENLKASAGENFTGSDYQEESAQIEDENQDTSDETEDQEVEETEDAVSESTGTAAHGAVQKAIGDHREKEKTHGAKWAKEREESAKRLSDHRSEVIQKSQSRLDELQNKLKTTADKEERGRIQDRISKIKKYLISRRGG
jgi:hypothetical protein